MMKVLLHGTGAIGTVYAYLLLKAGCEVTAVCRSNYEAAKANGLLIDSDLYGKGIRIAPNVVRTPAEAVSHGPFDYVIVATKVLPSAKNSEIIAPAVTPGHTSIVLMQNGVSIEEEYALKFPGTTILSCVIYLPSTQVKPGHIEMGNLETLQVGAYPSRSDRAEHMKAAGELLVSTLASAGGNATWFEDIQEKRWYKLLLNAAWNPICALSLCRDTAFLAASDVSNDVLKGVMGEIVAVAKKLGYESISPAAVDKQLQRALARIGHKGIEPSMLVDVLNGRRMEVEAILGNPIRVAKGLGVDVPRLELLYALAKGRDESLARSTPGQSLAGLLAEETKEGSDQSNHSSSAFLAE
jgi:2-dehydropantoate 2-reductase